MLLNPTSVGDNNLHQIIIDYVGKWYEASLPSYAPHTCGVFSKSTYWQNAHNEDNDSVDADDCSAIYSYNESFHALHLEYSRLGVCTQFIQQFIYSFMNRVTMEQWQLPPPLLLWQLRMADQS